MSLTPSMSSKVSGWKIFTSSFSIVTWTSVRSPRPDRGKRRISLEVSLSVARMRCDSPSPHIHRVEEISTLRFSVSKDIESSAINFGMRPNLRCSSSKRASFRSRLLRCGRYACRAPYRTIYSSLCFLPAHQKRIIG